MSTTDAVTGDQTATNPVSGESQTVTVENGEDVVEDIGEVVIDEEGEPVDEVVPIGAVMPVDVQPQGDLEPIGQVMPVGIVPSADLEPVGDPLPTDVVPPTNVYPAPLTSDDDDEPEVVPASIALNEEGTTIVQQVPTFGSDEDE